MYYVGIDLGGTNIAAGIVTQDYKIIAKDSVPTLPNRDPELIIKDMGALRQAPCQSKHLIRRSYFRRNRHPRHRQQRNRLLRIRKQPAVFAFPPRRHA